MASTGSDLDNGNNNGEGNGNGAAPATPKAKPSDKQLNLLAIIMQNVEEQPKVDWVNVASQAGLKNERVAKEMYRQMCKKFCWNKGGTQNPASASSSTTTTTTTATPGGTCKTPTKVTKQRAKAGSTVKTHGRGRKTTSGCAIAEKTDLGDVADQADPFMSSPFKTE